MHPRPRDLVIVEASGKVDFLTRKLANIGIPALVMATVGHVADSPPTLFPLGLDSRLNETSYLPKPGKASLLLRLHDAARLAGRVYLATDDDQEGDVIAYDLATLMPDCASKMYRVRLRALSEDELSRAFTGDLSQDFETPSRNGRCRRILDRAIGGSFSELVTPQKVVIGRVQSALLASLAEYSAPLGEFNLSVMSGDGIYRCAVDVDTLDRLNQLQLIQQNLKKGQAMAQALAPIERSCGDPWGYEDIVLEASLKLNIEIKDAAQGLQTAYENGLVSYPRARANGYTVDAISVCSELAKRNRIGFDPTRMRKRSDDDGTGAPHESPRPLDGCLVLGRPLSVLGTPEAVAVLVARHVMACGQVESVKRLLVTASGEEFIFSMPTQRPRRPWKSNEDSDGFTPWTPAQSVLKFMSIRKLGRPSTIVDHVNRFLGRDLVDSVFALTPKGERWLSHARDAGLTAETSRQIELALEGPIESPAATARYLLGQHGLLEKVLLKIRQDKSDLNNHAAHSYQAPA